MTSTRKITQELFIQRCASHINCKNYNFSNTIYKNSRTLIEIECNVHGKFFCRPASIMFLGIGCKLCDRKNAHRTKSHLNLLEYKELASKLHNNKYNYSLIDVNSDKIKVICPAHGEFLIRKSAHISPSQLYGCQKCGNKKSLGEDSIIKFLIDHKINYEYQKNISLGKVCGRPTFSKV